MRRIRRPHYARHLHTRWHWPHSLRPCAPQMAVFSLSSQHEEDAGLRQHGPLMFSVSLVLVLIQCVVMASISLGAFLARR